MEKNIEDFLKNNPDPSNEDLANFIANLEAENNSTPTADKLLAPGAAMYESHMFHPRVPKDNTSSDASSDPSVPTSPDAVPEKQKISLDELYRWLDSRLTFTQNTFDAENSPIILKIFEKDFKVSESVAKQVIEKLKKIGVIDGGGKINRGALNTEIKDRDEVWEFAGEPYEPATPALPTSAATTVPSIPVTATIPPTPTTPTIETSPKPTSLTNGEVLDFILKRFEAGKLTLIANDLKIKFGIDQTLAEVIIDRLERESRIIKKNGNEYVCISDLAEQIKNIRRDVDFIKETPKPIPVEPKPAAATVPPIPPTPPSPAPSPAPEPTPEKTSLNSGHILDFILAQFRAGKSNLTSKELQDEFNITKILAEKIIEKLDKEAGLIIKNGDSYTYNKGNFEEQIKNIPRDETITEEDDRPFPEGVNAEPTPEQLEEAVRRAEAAKNTFFNFANLKKYRYYIYALIAALGPLVVNQGINNYKSLAENSGGSEPLMSASANNIKNGKSITVGKPLPSANPTNEKAPTAQILNPNYKKTAWWESLNNEVKPVIEQILNAEDAKTYTLPFLREVEILNTREVVTLSDKDMSDLYDQIKNHSNFLNSVFTNLNIQIPECIVTLQDKNTREKRTCNLRMNVANIAKGFMQANFFLFGGKMREAMPPQETTADSYNRVKAGIIAKINAETANKK